MKLLIQGVCALQDSIKNNCKIDKTYLEENAQNYFDNWRVNKVEKGQIPSKIL